MSRIPNFLISACLVGTCATISKAAVYTTSFAIAGSPAANPVPAELRATTEPLMSGNGAYLQVSIDGTLKLRPTNYTVGIPHSWYVVSQGTVIDPTWISTATPFASSPVGQPATMDGVLQLTNGKIFIMGFWLDNGNNTPGTGDRFGWAKIQYTTAAGLVLLDNAIDDSGYGIIAGTTTAVPEPSLHWLVAMGASGCLLKRKRRG